MGVNIEFSADDLCIGKKGDSLDCNTMKSIRDLLSQKLFLSRVYTFEV